MLARGPGVVGWKGDGVKAGRSGRVAIVAAWACAAGCSTLREIPRSQYAVQPERKNVQVETVDGERLEFDNAQFTADSLIGTRHRDDEGPIEEVDTRVLALEHVRKLQARQVDWYRTGLIGGVIVAGIVAAVLSQTGGDSGTSDNGPCGPRPCP